jgi:beta-glucosidase
MNPAGAATPESTAGAASPGSSTSSQPAAGQRVVFPEGFLWGVSTSAYQIEGAVADDGRGPSVWDTFARQPGTTCRGDTGDVACDSYHRLTEDLDLLSDLGVTGYRFSVSWPRVQPDGRGAVNQAGLDYYQRLVDGLRERNIEPLLTLYHWDLPQPLEDAGGWPRRDTAQRFAEFAAIMGAAVGDRVTRWITLNEPQVVANLGYRLGIHAPGHRDWPAAAATTHHLLLGHGLALEALRSELRSSARIGISLNLTAVRPATPDQAGPAARLEAETNRIFLEPVLSGRYPEGDARAELLPPADLIADGDLATIGAPIDFLGVNYYQAPTVGYRAASDNARHDEERVDGHPDLVRIVPAGTQRSAMGWPIDSSGLYDLLTLLHSRAPGLPLYITENGMAAEDYVDPDGQVNDQDRIAYLRDHLTVTAQAIADGVNVRGYCCWSLLDNFEWAAGYQKRFGLVFVDYGTQQRIKKASAAFYQQVAKENALPG